MSSFTVISVMWVVSMLLCLIKTERLAMARLVILAVCSSLLLFQICSITVLRAPSAILIGGVLGVKHVLCASFSSIFIILAIATLFERWKKTKAANVFLYLANGVSYLMIVSAIWFVIERVCILLIANSDSGLWSESMSNDLRNIIEPTLVFGSIALSLLMLSKRSKLFLAGSIGGPISASLLWLWFGWFSFLGAPSIILIAGIGAKHLFYIGLPLLVFCMLIRSIVAFMEKQGLGNLMERLTYAALCLFAVGGVWFVIEQGYIVFTRK